MISEELVSGFSINVLTFFPECRSLTLLSIYSVGNGEQCSSEWLLKDLRHG